MLAGIKRWLLAARALYSSTIVIPCIVGGVVAWYEGGFTWPPFILVLVALFFANIGTNFTNDYYDYKSGVDRIDEGRKYKSGSEVFLSSGLTARTVLASALASLAITIAIGLYLVVAIDWRILLFGLAGVFIAYFYTAPPVRLGYRGFGELACWLGCGPLPVIGTYFVLTGHISVTAIAASIPVGLLITAILYIGNVPDAEADAKVGKKTTSVRLGRRAVRFLGPLFYIAIYLSIVLSIVLASFPLWTLLTFLSLPLVIKLLSLTRTHYANIAKYAPAIMMTVRVFMLTSGLLIIGFALGYAF
ncbi:MAG: 1,4-dihydroxy-2-naphthoate octaprenyltransferase [Chloroflexi bacterium]|nr:1,4-dihydroxy-2-naphthoate octaprenyltransferase [Chloroflexota bacterium]